MFLVDIVCTPPTILAFTERYSHRYYVAGVLRIYQPSSLRLAVLDYQWSLLRVMVRLFPKLRNSSFVDSFVSR